MTRHVLALDGEPWDGEWFCVRCQATFAYAADGYRECEWSFPWGTARLARFRAAVRKAHASMTRRPVLRDGTGLGESSGRGDLPVAGGSANPSPRPTN